VTAIVNTVVPLGSRAALNADYSLPAADVHLRVEARRLSIRRRADFSQGGGAYQPGCGCALRALPRGPAGTV